MTDLDLDKLLRAQSWHEVVVTAIRLVGWQRWDRRVRELERLWRRYDFLQRRISETHNFELSLLRLHRRAMLTNTPPSLDDPPMRDALSMATILANLADALPTDARKRLAGQVKNALDYDSGFGPLRAELTYMLALASYGCKVVAVDLEGENRFDFLARRGDIAIEVECKFITLDAGLRFHRRAFNRLCMALYDRHRGSIKRPGSSTIVTLTVKTLPTREEDVRKLAGAIGQSLEDRCAERWYAESLIQVEDWPPGSKEPYLVHEEARKLSKVLLCANVATNEKDSCFIINVKSDVLPNEQAARQLAIVSRTIREASRQFTGDRPAMIFVEFEGQGSDVQGKLLLAHFVDQGFQKWAGRFPFVARIAVGFPGLPFSGGEIFMLKNPASPGNALFDDLDESGKPMPWPEGMLSWRRSWRAQWP